MRKIIASSIFALVAFALSAQTASISGTILHTSGEAMTGVTVKVLDSQDQVIAEVELDSDGQYTVPNLTTGETYTVKPERLDNPLNGLSTFDMVLGARHILGIQELDEPYKYLAMDVNDTKSLTTLDLVIKRRMILFIIQEFPDNIPSWRFFRSDYTFNPNNPFQDMGDIYTRSVLLSEDVDEIDFTGFKMGDLNQSAFP